MIAKFQHCDEEMAKILDDKDSKNIKKGSKGNDLILKAYLQERNIKKPATPEQLATVSENSTPKLAAILIHFVFFELLEIF